MGRSRYRAGFASGFVARTSIAATVGGTASEIGGGKFANGAVTGAFVELYNELGHESQVEEREEYIKRQVLMIARDPNVTDEYRMEVLSLLLQDKITYQESAWDTASVGNSQQRAEFLGVTAADFNSFKITGRAWNIYGDMPASLAYQVRHTLLHETTHILTRNNLHSVGFDNPVGDMGYGYGR